MIPQSSMSTISITAHIQDQLVKLTVSLYTVEYNQVYLNKLTFTYYQYRPLNLTKGH